MTKKEKLPLKATQEEPTTPDDLSAHSVQVYLEDRICGLEKTLGQMIERINLLEKNMVLVGGFAPPKAVLGPQETAVERSLRLQSKYTGKVRAE